MVFRPKEKRSIILFFGGGHSSSARESSPTGPQTLKTGHVRRYPMERTLFSWMPRGMHTDLVIRYGTGEKMKSSLRNPFDLRITGPFVTHPPTGKPID